jgi:hypothetical protein
VEKTKYMLLSHQNRGIRIGNRSFENVSQFKYLGTNQNLIQKEVKRKLNSGNACYRSVQNHLSSCLLPKNVKLECARLICMGAKLGL